MSTLAPLAVAALGLLQERPMHPYEMFQLMMRRAEDRLVKVRPGTLYNAVDRLARDGFVAEQTTERAGNRPERTVYAITDAGRAALLDRVAELIARPVPSYPEFPLGISEAHNLPRLEVIPLVQERLDGLQIELAALDAAIARVTERGVHRRFWIDTEYSRALVAAETAWVEGFLAELATDAVDWESPLPDGHPTSQTLFTD